jgi:NADH dehydrogenase/NADH:ubiquinone oxidoreductase subunit G
MTVRFKIDDVDVEAQESDLLIDVARQNDFDIPSLCHHEALEPIGACRVCLVEVSQGTQTQLTTACDHKVESGMEVLTDSAEIRKQRAMNLELLLARAPKAEAIRHLAAQYNVRRPRFSELEYNPLPNCILCELCVRTCAHLGHHALTTVGRGDKKRIGLPFDKPSESCVGCGSCVSVCPTDCVFIKDSPTQRTLWGQRHDFVLCKECNAPVMTYKHREHAIAASKLPEDYYDTCEQCKQTAASKRFAAVVW